MPTPELHSKDGLEIIEFPDAAAWEQWLEANHGTSKGVWVKTAKKSAAVVTVTHADALTSAICFGWIDGQRHPYDGTYYLQRFTPRGPRSKWSQVNRAKALDLIEGNRMRPAGQAEVDRAKRDGRWDAAYEPQSRATVPEDFQRELDSNPSAKAFFATLRGANRYAFLYRIGDAKRPETRAKRIASFIEMLNEGKTFYP